MSGIIRLIPPLIFSAAVLFARHGYVKELSARRDEYNGIRELISHVTERILGTGVSLSAATRDFKPSSVSGAALANAIKTASYAAERRERADSLLSHVDREDKALLLDFLADFGTVSGEDYAGKLRALGSHFSARAEKAADEASRGEGSAAVICATLLAAALFLFL